MHNVRKKPARILGQEILSSVLNLLKLTFQYQVVYLTVLVRNCLDANIDIGGIFSVPFYQKAQGENASKLSVLCEIRFTPAG